MPNLPSSSIGTARNFAVLLTLAAGLAYLGALYFSQTLSHDQAWCLYAAERMLDDTQIYGSQLIETNPPLILWFSLLPVALARLTHVPEAVTLHLVVLLLAAASTALCYCLLRGVSTVPRLFFTAAVFFTETAILPSDLAQREQLLVLLILPCLLAFATGAATLTRLHLLALGFVAGVGVCFKPQQLTILIALQIGVLLGHGPRAFFRRREWIAVLGAFAACLLYVAAVRLITPLYFTTLTPILVDTYWALGRYTFLKLIRTEHHFPEILLTVTVLYLWGRHRKLLSAAPGFLLLASAGACIGYGIQHAGFPYHRIPQNGFVELAMVWIGIELAAKWLPSLFAPTPLTRLQVALSALTLGLFFTPFARARNAEVNAPPPAHSVQGFLRSLSPGTPVWSLSVDLSAHFPDILTDRLVWASRFNHLWMLPAMQQNLAMRTGGPTPAKILSPATLQSLEAMQRQAGVEDLARWQPQFILVPQCRDPIGCLGFSAPFDTLAWFRQSPAFAAAWSRYRYRDTLPNLHNGALFDVYEKKN